MKVCKKCKKKVANNKKKCPYCGADVSKAKIIVKQQQLKLKEVKPKNSDLLVEEPSVNGEFKQADIVKTKKTKYDKMVSNQKRKLPTSSNSKKIKKKVANNTVEKSEKNKATGSTKSKISIKVIKETPKAKMKPSAKKKEKRLTFKVLVEKFNYKIKEQSQKIRERIKTRQEGKKSKQEEKNRLDNLKKLENAELKEIELKRIEEEKHLEKLSVEKSQQEEKQLKDEITDIDQQNNKQPERDIIEKTEKVKVNDDSSEQGIPISVTRTHKILLDIKNKIYEEPEESEEITYLEKKNKFFNKRLLAAFVICILVITVIFLFFQLFRFVSLNSAVLINESNYGTTYEMNKRVEYDGLIYKVTSAKIVDGTEYKKPKDGNVFILVTMELSNGSKDKVKYSYKNIKMSNSKNEESTRVFTPINASNALYSGSIVVGASKTGSLVFEEPIDDKDLYLNFYKTEDIVKDDAENTSDNVEQKQILLFKVKIDLTAE